MELWDWFGQNWFVLLQSAGIIGSLLFTGFTIRSDLKERRIANLFALTQNHRDIWENLFSLPELARVLDPSPDLNRIPITSRERLFVLLIILHLNAAFRAFESGLLKKPEELKRDIHTLFSLPIPYAVWLRMKEFQDAEFVRFVESSRQPNHS